MYALRMLIPLLAAGAIATACAETTPTLAPTRTTSALVATKSSDLAPAREPEPSATGAAVDESSTRCAADAAMLREKDELEIRVLEAMENSDLALQALRERSQEASFKDWLVVDKAMRNAQRYKSALMEDLRRLRGDLGMMTWPVFKRIVEAKIGELDEVVAHARASSHAPR